MDNQLEKIWHFFSLLLWTWTTDLILSIQRSCNISQYVVDFTKMIDFIHFVNFWVKGSKGKEWNLASIRRGQGHIYVHYVGFGLTIVYPSYYISLLLFYPKANFQNPNNLLEASFFHYLYTSFWPPLIDCVGLY